MSFFNRYLKIQFKRTAKLYLIVLCLTLVLLTILGSVGYVMLQKQQNDESLQKVKIGIVGDDQDKMLKMGVELIKTMDTSSFSIEFFNFDTEDDAVNAMSDSTIDTYVYIPKDFGISLWRGKDVKLTYVMAKKSASTSTLLTRDIIDVVSNYIVKTQVGVNAMCNYAEKEGFSNKEIDDIDIDMSIKYIDLIVKRESMVEMNETGLGNSLSMIGYYICGFTVFFLLCFGITCSPLRVKNNNSLDKLLYSRGCSTIDQAVAEFIPFFAVSFITLLIPFVAVGIASNYIELGIYELEYLHFGDYIGIMFKLIPVILIITAFQFLLYELVSGIINSVLLQFTVAIILGYISGCFYPISFMPEVLQRVSAVLPVGLAIDYFGSVLSYTLSFKKFAICMLYTVLLLALGIVIRKIKIQKLEGQ